MIDGVASDLEPRQFQTFEELYRYCYQVASVAGLIGSAHPRIRVPQAPWSWPRSAASPSNSPTSCATCARTPSAAASIFPAEDLARFGVSRARSAARAHSEGIPELMRFETARARAYYQESAPLVGMVRRKNRRALWALIEIYRRLLEKIERTELRGFRRSRPPDGGGERPGGGQGGHAPPLEGVGR